MKEVNEILKINIIILLLILTINVNIYLYYFNNKSLIDIFSKVYFVIIYIKYVL